ncbi:MAG TPA: hypothetical protein VJH22_02965 [Candidatus Nanoarchaeia archaeon]|nr:hypothetical protein [Candidatus Nanoarchaeia archaeon]
MADERLRAQERLAAQGDPAERLRLLRERARCGQPLFDQHVYEQVSRWRRHLPPNVVKPNITRYPQPRDGEAAEINQLLLTILHDEILAMAMYLGSSPIDFATRPPGPHRRGYHGLKLHQHGGMSLTLREPSLVEPGDDWNFFEHGLFYTQQGVYYSSSKKVVLAANDVRGYDRRGKFNPERAMTSAQVLQSLEDAIAKLPLP